MTEDQWNEAFGQLPVRIIYGDPHARGDRYYVLNSLEIEEFVRLCIEIENKPVDHHPV